MTERWGQELVGATHGRSEGFRSLNDLVDERAAEQREGAGAHGRTGVVLASRDHLDGQALVAAKALAIDGRGLELAPRVTVTAALAAPAPSALE
jgi:hypothetical protein